MRPHGAVQARTGANGLGQDPESLRVPTPRRGGGYHPATFRTAATGPDRGVGRSERGSKRQKYVPANACRAGGPGEAVEGRSYPLGRSNVVGGWGVLVLAANDEATVPMGLTASKAL